MKLDIVKIHFNVRYAGKEVGTRIVQVVAAPVLEFSPLCLA